MPSFSPDGRALVFCRLSGFSASEVYLQHLGTDLQASGKPRMLTSHKRWATNPVWVRNGRNILYILGERPDAALRRELRMIDASGVQVSERTIPLAEPAYQMTAGRRLVYSVLTREANIWRAKIPDPGEPPTTAEVFIASTWPDSAARYSPDGKYIAFVSERSGSPEIYVSSSTGSNPRRITSFEGPLIGPPFWSPDGHWLVFHARTHGQGDIHEIRATGGSPTQLTTNTSDNVMPSYSHDGRSIYFNSSRSGQRQIWKMPAGGGQAVQITSGGGQRPIESADGKTIYYFANAGSIWQVPSAGGVEAEVVAPVHESAVGMAVTSTGIYYPTPPYSGDDCEIRFFSFASRRSRPIAHIQRPTGWTISVSPDDQYVIFAQMEKPKHDLMLADPFQLP
jgi:Tol biopolymer transport system component